MPETHSFRIQLLRADQSLRLMNGRPGQFKPKRHETEPVLSVQDGLW
jgi:hypothetical protein